MCFNTLYRFFCFLFFFNCVVLKSHLNEIVSYKNLKFMFISENVRTNKIVTTWSPFTNPSMFWLAVCMCVCARACVRVCVCVLKTVNMFSSDKTTMLWFVEKFLKCGGGLKCRGIAEIGFHEELFSSGAFLWNGQTEVLQEGQGRQ